MQVNGVPAAAFQRPEESTTDFRGGLASRSFLGLLVTQFLGALNDNMFRWLVVPIGMHYVGPKYASAALSAGFACFVLPYILLAAPAGYLADRFSKRSVIVWCKVAELVILLLGLAAIAVGNVYFLFAVVALLGGQAALFGPSKLGSIPEMLRPEKISAANGLVGLTTVLAIIVGTVAGYALFGLTQPDGRSGLWISALAVLGVSVVGWLASLFVAPLPPASPDRDWPRNPLAQTLRDLRVVAGSRPLFRVVLGSAFFWSLGSLAQVNVDSFGITELGLLREQVGPLLAVMALGVGAGSVLAGVWSGGRVELGLVPLGAAGIALSSLLLFAVPEPTVQAHGPAFWWTCCWLFLLGTSAGLFDVPLAAYIQHRSPPAQRGSVLAAANFLTFSGMLGVAGLFSVLRSPTGPLGDPLFSSRQIFLLSGLMTLPIAGYAFTLLPQATIRFVAWLASHTAYRVKVVGRGNLPERGGALLAANHVSWIDGILLMLTSSRPIRMVVHADYVQAWWIRPLARIMGAIPIRPGRKSVVESIRAAREALAAGDLVCIFPEGGITRTGELQAFRPGLLSILKGTGAPVIPVYLDELWGSIFSYYGGKFFWKWPRQWPYPVSIAFGRPVPGPESVEQVREAVVALGAQTVAERTSEMMILPRVFLRACRRNRRRPKVADSTGAELTGGGLLTRTLVLRQLLQRHILSPDEKFVGVLLPPSVGGVVVNAALPLCGRVAVNLNYTLSSDVLNSCIRECGIRRVLTSRKVMEKLDLDIEAELVYLEDFRDRVSMLDKLRAAFDAQLCPLGILERRLGLHKIALDDLLAVIFTSGSTGEPKGVMLSHRNIGSNIDAIDQIIKLTKQDVLAGILPFFHSFGYTTNLWTVLALDPKGVYHFTPLEARQVGSLCRKHRATILISTPTFLRSYLRRCPPEDFTALEVVLAGAEKLPVDLCQAFEQKFGVRPVEGYGTTELSPLVSVNIPPTRATQTGGPTIKEGTVGRPVPGVSAKVVDLDTGRDLPAGESGMLWIKGPNVMLGYLNRPDQTAEVLHDGWYKTGDVARIDADGFLEITGRESRFSKIGGEMVPHLMIEETLQRIVSTDEEELRAVVTGIPDERKGERLVVLHTLLEKTPDQICRELAAAGLPNLWIPSPDSFRQIDHIPVLGTGKLDLHGLKTLAAEKFGLSAAEVKS